MKRQGVKSLNLMNGFDYWNYLLMFLVVAITIYPLYYCAIVSVSDGAAVIRGDVIWHPIGFDLKAYEVVFSNEQILGAYANTIYYTVLGTVVNIIMTALCAYPLSRPRLKGRRTLNFLCMLTMFINGGMIPMYLQIKSLNLLDTTWAIVFPGAISTYNMIIMRTFFSSIPEELHEAAEIDGASQFQVFRTVILPHSQTIIATLVLFYAVGHWNSFMSALLYLEEQRRMPLQIIIRKMVIDSDLASMTTANSSSSSNETLLSENKIKYAIVMISVLPMVVAYPFLQRYFVRGVMIGAIKG